MAWVIAKICASVNEPSKGDPRCPLVPKLTRCVGSSRSGRRSKYSFSRRDRSTSISFGAGLPASGEMSICVVLSMGSGKVSLWDRARFRVPDLGRVLGDCPVAGELAGAGDIQNCFARPSIAVCVEFAKTLIRIKIGLEVRQMHVVVAMRKQRVVNGSENPRLIAA